ncbi:MAG: DUF6770 family protein [Cytophagaceae bacterium]
MKRHILPIWIVMLMLITFSGFSQSAEITNVRKKEFRGVYPIMNKQTNTPQGYYTFYVNEKVGGGMINFIIAIFDLDLKIIKQTPITITKHSSVDGSEFNGEDFLFVFNDLKKKTLTYVTADKNGDIIKTKGIVEAKRYAATADVYPSSNGGFYIVKPIKEKKWGYSVERVDRNLNTQWEKRFMPEKGIVTAEAVESRGDQIIVVQSVRPTITSKKVKAEFVCLADQSGENVFNYSLYDGEATAVPSAFYIDKDKNIVTGGMYFDGEKMDATNSDGIFFLKLSPKGEKLAYSKIDWDNGIQAVLKSTKKGLSIGSKPKVYFQDITQTKDGNYQVISETFKKNIQLMSSPLKDMISGRYIGWVNDNSKDNKPVTFEIMDFMFFTFDDQAKLTNMNIVEKEHTKISVYRPYNSMYGLQMARMVDKFGWFNYGFLTTSASGENLLISKNFAISDAYIGINTMKTGEVSETHKIPVNKRSAKGGRLGCMPGRPGDLCIFLFDKKEEVVFMYLEKIKLR